MGRVIFNALMVTVLIMGLLFAVLLPDSERIVMWKAECERLGGVPIVTSNDIICFDKAAIKWKQDR